MSEEMKLCRACGATKPIDEFSIMYKRTGARRADCRVCCNLLKQKWQRENGKDAYQRYKAGSAAWKWKHMHVVRDTVNKLKSEPCTDCGNRFNPWVMDFDHLDGKTKIGNVATMIRQARPLAAILEEISKCELVCANCHRNRTYQRQERHWYEPPHQGK
jgi:hypothetical protein